jgi:uncharacterized protein (TIGR00251 family)
METVRAVDGGAELEVWVVPGASRSEVSGLYAGRVRIRVTAPATGNRANRAVEAFLQSILGHPARVVRGHRSRHKRVRVDAVAPCHVRRVLGV